MYLFMAGFEAWSDQFLEAGVRYNLGTYYYLRTNRAKHAIIGDWRRMKEKHPDRRIFLDSGAFTYQMQHQAGGVRIEPDAYFKEFMYFLKHNHDIFDIVAEFDIDGIVDIAQVLEYRRLMIELLGPKLCVVWHNSHTRQQMEEWAKDPRYKWMAISSDATSVGKTMSTIASMRRAGKYVHVLGQTRVQTDMKYMGNANSCDSTSWLRATKYGTTFVYKPGNLIADNAPRDTGKKQAFRTTHKLHFQRLGLDFEKLLADDPKETAKHAIYAWRDYAIRLHATGGARGSSRVDWTYGGAHDGPKRSNTMSAEDTPKTPPATPKGARVKISLALNGKGQLTPTKIVKEGPTPSQNPPEGPLDASQTDAIMAPEPPKRRPKKGRLYALGQRLRGFTVEEMQGRVNKLNEENLKPCPVCGETPGPSEVINIKIASTQHDDVGTTTYENRTGHISCWKRIGAPTEWPQTERSVDEDNQRAQENETGANKASTLELSEGRDSQGKGAYLIERKGTGKDKEGGAAPTTDRGEHTGIEGTPPSGGMPRSSRDGGGTSASMDRASGTPRDMPRSSDSGSITTPAMDRGRSLPVLQGANVGIQRQSDVIEDAFGALPKLACSTCSMAGSCEEFREGYVCAYLPVLEGLNVRDAGQVMSALQQIAVVQFKRALLAYMNEQTSAGGAIDPRVTAQLQVARDALHECLQMTKATEPKAVPARLTIQQNVDGSTSVAATMPAGTPGGGAPGILARMFGAPSPAVHDDPDSIDAIVDVAPLPAAPLTKPA